MQMRQMNFDELTDNQIVDSPAPSDYGYDYRQDSLTANEYAAELFMDSIREYNIIEETN